ncbi:hypothetical protein [Modicisalibacter tunisiensis]|uniref:Uncharacterized protein n=1 Tax=Modicisalibacter tunisiensis TaxID=390637 RepID=A0ABS7WVS1_9GAMM|nr:hypothetical protein [Modicisalibacter tunisiensis]MBZ9566686.1 hypothetical protein [Modicisalibacter tunisiensis]
MLTVTLELQCHVCGGERFLLPMPADSEQAIHCADCRAFKCHGDDLERLMAAAGNSWRDRAERAAC